PPLLGNSLLPSMPTCRYVAGYLISEVVALPVICSTAAIRTCALYIAGRYSCSLGVFEARAQNVRLDVSMAVFPRAAFSVAANAIIRPNTCACRRATSDWSEGVLTCALYSLITA